MDMAISVFEYDNYRTFLKEAYDSLKEKDKKFSFRFFSKATGFKSSSVLKMIIDGKRNMGSQAVDRFAQALKLNADEADFFKILVSFNQATDSAEKHIFAQKLMNFKEFKKSHPLTESQYNFCAFWYMPVIWELSGLPEFRKNPDWIAKKILPRITASQAKAALEDLVELGLLVPSAHGQLKKAQTFVRTTNEVASSAVSYWHREMIKLASESIERFPREKRDISSITISMSEKSFVAMKEKIQKLRKDLLKMAAEDPSPKMVYQMNFQLFPVADTEGESAK